MQLVFKNDVKTPLLQHNETGEKDFKLKSADAKNSNSIRQISVKSHGPNIDGLRLIDSNGDYIVDIEWYERKTVGEWITQTLEEDEALIGFKCDKRMIGLSFILYKPS